MKPRGSAEGSINGREQEEKLKEAGKDETQSKS